MRIWPRTAQERGVFWSIVEGFANTVFAYLAMALSPVVVLFLSELGLNKTQIGAIRSLMPFSGLLALFVAPAVARWGLKRTFLTFWGIRKGITALLVFTPWVAATWGVSAAFAYLLGIVGVFAVCRAIGETAYNPWSLDFVPAAIRGQYGAVSQVSSTLANLLAVGIAAFVMGRVAGLDKYIVLILIGVGFGVLSVIFSSFIPRETTTGAAGGSRAHFRAMLQGLRRPEYVRYLAGFGLTVLPTAAWAFLPLFMIERVGLSSQEVVTLQTGTLLGGLLFGYLWGWLADRRGANVVVLSNLAVRVLLPLGWLLMPRQSASSLLVAQVIAFFDGATSIGFHIGATRLLYVRIVPPAQKTSYLALYYAWVGLVGGVAPLIAGRVLDASAHLAGRWGFVIVDAYTSIFLVGAALYALSILLFRAAPADIGTRR